jgi:VanZ family protein
MSSIPLGWRRAVLVLALVTIFVLSLMPVPEGLQVFSWQDKVEHAGAFAMLGLMAAFACLRPARLWVLGLLVYGALIELAQSTVPYRSADPADWAADAIGVAIAVLVTRRWQASAADQQGK